MDQKREHKPHCLILPYPSQGHINPLIQFSKRLAHKGITITFAVPQDVLTSSSAADISASIAVETISDGYNSAAARADADPREYLVTFKKEGTESTSRLIEKLREGRGRAVDCVVYDAFLPWGLAVAKSKGLFGAAFFTQASSVNVVYYNVFKGLLKVPVTERETVLPGLPSLAVSDLPSFVVDQEKYPGVLELLVGQFDGVEDSDFVFVNSVYELEEKANEWMKKSMSIQTIGPAIPSIYLDKRIQHDKNYGLSLFKPDDICMRWLQQRSPKSVIYVSFGSIAKLEKHEMEELATALKLTGKHFLWVVRSSEVSKLPENFTDEASGKGLIVSWCSQLEVLAHDAIGCFVTHCGWNSTLEALSLGVPMVGVPWWSDQATNAKFVMDVWKMGVRAYPDDGGVVGHEELVRCVNCVMEGERAEEMRENARKWKELAKGAVNEGGSSDRNIQQFVSTLMGVTLSLSQK
ncbi:UDP-glycosyltransferase 74E1-like [Salvia splendens]|uniref:UDP-glycosyltransferase 74E1-like n=1 Tax=Salvia splendens TaxID=180675 RepID=UPI001C277180|nr:UDP-glycosyltransferase 74E1-like [Salvia splendens]